MRATWPVTERSSAASRCQLLSPVGLLLRRTPRLDTPPPLPPPPSPPALPPPVSSSSPLCLRLSTSHPEIFLVLYQSSHLFLPPSFLSVYFCSHFSSSPPISSLPSLTSSPRLPPTRTRTLAPSNSDLRMSCEEAQLHKERLQALAVSGSVFEAAGCFPSGSARHPDLLSVCFAACLFVCLSVCDPLRVSIHLSFTSRSV